jgi:hypothetical protein
VSGGERPAKGGWPCAEAAGGGKDFRRNDDGKRTARDEDERNYAVLKMRTSRPHWTVFRHLIVLI